MAESKHSKYICTELKKDIRLPGFRPGERLNVPKPGEQRTMNHVIWMDSEVVPGAFYSECVWFFPGRETAEQQIEKEKGEGGPQRHSHPFSEIITFFGTNFDDPHDLGGEVELWLEDEQYIMTNSFLAYIPAGMNHCPLKINRMDRPMFHFTMGPGQSYQGVNLSDTAKEQRNTGKVNTAGKQYANHFIFQDKPDLVLPEFRHEIPPEYAHRIVYLDSEVFPGADFYVEALWFWPGERPEPEPGEDKAVPPHTHPFGEAIAFFGTNPDDIHDLGGEVELWIDGEQNVMDKSFMAFIPAGTVHCPLKINRIDRPLFHFTAGPGRLYSGSGK